MGKKGYKHTEDAKQKISLAGKGRKHSLGARLKISKAHKGMKFSEEHKRNISLSKEGVFAGDKNYFFSRQFVGSQNSNWKGNNVGYRAIHRWVEKWRGKPDVCQKCGKSGLTGREIHWANIDHQYKRILEDWIRLCAKCHGEHDTELRKKI